MYCFFVGYLNFFLALLILVWLYEKNSAKFGLHINFKPNLHYCARGPVLFSIEVIQKVFKKSLGLILVVKWLSLETFSQHFHCFDRLLTKDYYFCLNMTPHINFKPNLHYCARGPVLFSFEVIQKACEKKSLGLILVVKWMVSDVQTCTCQGRRNQGEGVVRYPLPDFARLHTVSFDWFCPI